MGMDMDTKRAVVDGGFNLVMSVVSTLGGVWLGGKALPKDSTKGMIIGGAVGYFAHLLARQNFSLMCIADNTEKMTR